MCWMFPRSPCPYGTSQYFCHMSLYVEPVLITDPVVLGSGNLACFFHGTYLLKLQLSLSCIAISFCQAAISIQPPPSISQWVPSPSLDVPECFVISAISLKCRRKQGSRHFCIMSLLKRVLAISLVAGVYYPRTAGRRSLSMSLFKKPPESWYLCIMPTKRQCFW